MDVNTPMKSFLTKFLPSTKALYTKNMEEKVSIELCHKNTKKSPKNNLNEQTYLQPLKRSRARACSEVRKKDKDNIKTTHKQKRSTSLTNKKYPERKRRLSSTLKTIAHDLPLKKKESFNSILCNKNTKKKPKNNLNEQTYLQPLKHSKARGYSEVRKKGKENIKTTQKQKRSTSLTKKKYPERKRRLSSTLKKIAHDPPLVKSESYNSVLCNKNTKKNPKNNLNEQTYLQPITHSRARAGSEVMKVVNPRESFIPIEGQWADKSPAVYPVMSPPSKPAATKYWVRSELQYVVLLPTDRKRRKSLPSREPPPTDVPCKSPSILKSPSPLPQPIPTRPTRLSEEPIPPEYKGLGDQDKESFLSTSSTSSFESRSQAKLAPKPKGRFCCFRRQNSG